VGQNIAGAEPSAIHYTIRARYRIRQGVDVEPNSDAQSGELLCQDSQRGARIQMTLILDEQNPVESPGQIGLQSPERLAIDPFKPFGTTRKIDQLTHITRVSDHQSPVVRCIRKSLAPPSDTRGSQLRDNRLTATCLLAPWSQHATRVPGAARRPQICAAFEDLDRGTSLCELQGTTESPDSGADDSDIH